MIKPKFSDLDYGEGRKDLSWMQYAKSLKDYVIFLESENPLILQELIDSKKIIIRKFAKELNKRRYSLSLQWQNDVLQT